MIVSESQRRDLYNVIVDILGTEHADTLMSLLPTDPTELATRADIAELRAEMVAGFESIDRRFAQIDQRLEDVDRRFAQIDQRFEDVDGRALAFDHQFAEIRSRLDRMEGRFMGVDDRLTSLDHAVAAINSRLDRLFHTLLLTVLALFGTVLVEMLLR